MQVTFIHSGRKQGITLQGDRLAFITARYPHVTDQHVRQTSNQELSYNPTFRRSLSRSKSPFARSNSTLQESCAEIRCFTSPKSRLAGVIAEMRMGSQDDPPSGLVGRHTRPDKCCQARCACGL